MTHTKTISICLDIEVEVEGIIEKGQKGDYYTEPISDQFIIHSIKWHDTEIMDLLDREKYDINDMAAQILETL